MDDYVSNSWTKSYCVSNTQETKLHSLLIIRNTSAAPLVSNFLCAVQTSVPQSCYSSLHSWSRNLEFLIQNHWSPNCSFYLLTLWHLLKTMISATTSSMFQCACAPDESIMKCQMYVSGFPGLQPLHLQIPIVYYFSDYLSIVLGPKFLAVFLGQAGGKVLILSFHQHFCILFVLLEDRIEQVGVCVCACVNSIRK